MKRKTKIAIAAGVALAAIGTGVGVATATFNDTEAPIIGTAYEEATKAALAHVGEGRVTETEAGDEDGAYEVEITRNDGTQVDVHLDAAFNVIGTKSDGKNDDADGS